MTDPRHLFGIFPYLKTSERVAFRSLILRPSTDTEGLHSDARDHWETLRTRFFLHDTAQITSPSFVCRTARIRSEEEGRFRRQLVQLQVLLSYLYRVPRTETGHPFLWDEHATFFIMYPERMPKVVTEPHSGLTKVPWLEDPPTSTGEFYRGYRASLNDRVPFALTEANRVYPPTPRMYINISQDIAADLGRWPSRQTEVFRGFARRSALSEFDERILTALTWYNRSARSLNERDLALVSLAIGFETLLGLPPGDSITARFKEAVTLLLGPVPRLDDWLTQFYDARSDVVHEGYSNRAMFRAGDQGQPYRSLLAYGRTIFRICAETVVSGARRAEELDIASLFRTNHERFQELCRILDEQGVSPEDRLERADPVIHSISRFQWVPESGLTIKQLLGAIKRAAKAYLSCSTEPPPVPEALSACATLDSKDPLEALARLEALKEAFDETDELEDLEGRIATTVRELVKVVWHYTFMYYFTLKREAEA